MQRDEIRVFLGGDYDRFDLEVRGGLLGRARLLMVQEEHGGGKQLLRFAVRSKLSRGNVILIILFAVLGILATVDATWVVSAVLLGFSATLAIRSRYEATNAVGAFRKGFQVLQRETEAEDARVEPD